MKNGVTIDEILKALEEEIARAKHQRVNASRIRLAGALTSEVDRWDAYIRDLEEKAAEIPFLFDEVDEDES